MRTNRFLAINHSHNYEWRGSLLSDHRGGKYVTRTNGPVPTKESPEHQQTGWASHIIVEILACTRWGLETFHSPTLWKQSECDCSMKIVWWIEQSSSREALNTGKHGVAIPCVWFVFDLSKRNWDSSWYIPSRYSSFTGSFVLQNECSVCSRDSRRSFVV